MKTICGKHGQAYEVGQNCPYCIPVVASAVEEDPSPLDWKSYLQSLVLPPPGDLWLHSAAIGEYKTQFALNLCHYLRVHRSLNILFVSFEDRRQTLNDKMEAIHGSSDFCNYPGFFSVHDGAHSVSDVEDEIKALQLAMLLSMQRLDLVVVDGFDVAACASQQGMVQLAQFSRSVGVSLLMTKQLNRIGQLPAFYAYSATYHTRTLKTTGTKTELICLKNKLAAPHGSVSIKVDKAYHRFE